MSEWKKVKLGDVSSAIQTGPFGSQLHQSDYSEIGVPVVMPKDIINGCIDESTIARVESHHVERLSRHKISEGDILYARRGDVGKCAYAIGAQKGWLCGTGCLRVTIDKEKALPKFIFFQLQKRETIGWVEKHAIGATMLNLNTSILSDVPIELPPFPTQNRIATILSRYDSLIENYQKQIKLLEEAAQRLYKEWFVDLRFPGHETTTIVDGVPEGWSKGMLDDIAYESGKKVDKRNRDYYDYYLPIDCLPKHSLTYLTPADISLAESSLVSFEENDIIFGAMRPYFHKICFAQSRGLTRTTCFVLNSNHKEFREFLLMLLFDDSTVKHATSISVGTTMPYTRWKEFKSMEIVIPAKEIAIAFGNKISSITKVLKDLSSQIRLLTEARDRLLPKLMSGNVSMFNQLRVR
jgi:type I restriction enzyme S subunit